MDHYISNFFVLSELIMYHRFHSDIVCWNDFSNHIIIACAKALALNIRNEMFLKRKTDIHATVPRKYKGVFL